MISLTLLNCIFFIRASRSQCRCGTSPPPVCSPLPSSQKTLPPIPETATKSGVKVDQRDQEAPWNYKEDTKLVPTDAFGDIEFDGFGENERKVWMSLSYNSKIQNQPTINLFHSCQINTHPLPRWSPHRAAITPAGPSTIMFTPP